MVWKGFLTAAVIGLLALAGGAGLWPAPGEGVALASPLPVAGLPGQAPIAGPARIVDGDTLRIGATRIRIHGIDAPELGETCRAPDGRAWDCGAWSARLARERFEGRRLVCHDLGERSHDRVVAQCRHGAEDVAAAMLRAGAARACERFARAHPHSAGYGALEAEAAAARRGLFAGTPPPRTGFCLPEGRAASASSRAASAEARPTPVRDGCVIKGNINRSGERIYHLPGQAFYDRVVIRPERGQRWFCSEAEARAVGWRRSQR